MIPLVYRSQYNITAFGLERLHPFDSRKYGRIHDYLIQQGLRLESDFVSPVEVSPADLSLVHSQEYLQSLKRSDQLASLLEVPVVGRLPAWLIDQRVLRPMRLACGGTMLAARFALQHRLAINLGGGFHHAAAAWGGGFCVYADIPIAAAALHREGLVKKVLVVDLDAHQGNGVAATIHDWPWISIFDLYEEDLFPSRKEPEDFPLPVPQGYSGDDYLRLVTQFLPEAIRSVRPDLLIYNAGSDPFQDDPLARLRLSAEDLAERDLLVVSLAQEHSVPVAMVLSGGYAAESWRIHAKSIEGLITRFDRIA